jgi:protein-tyrosine phosphatase
VIDIHSHILPGLDDGSNSLDQSVAMLRLAAEKGTSDIVASPHANQEYSFDPNVVEEKISQVQAAAGDTPRIHYGCDFHLTMENIEDALRAPEKYSIDHRGYLLVEFSDFLIPKTTDEIFARMIHAGLRPIITHPERNQLLVHRLDEIETWAAMGVLVQVTALSFLGQFGKTAKRTADALMEHGLAHFVASDAHDTRWRTTDLSEARKYVEKQFGPEAAERVFVENPRAVLAGVPIPTVPIPIKRKRWFSW